ncbi:hypothetical protein AgCh_013186 [Apium graveolens]
MPEKTSARRISEIEFEGKKRLRIKEKGKLSGLILKAINSEREGIQARKGKGILGGSSSTFVKQESEFRQLSKKMARLRRTARKSVPGGPYRVEGFRLPEQDPSSGSDSDSEISLTDSETPAPEPESEMPKIVPVSVGGKLAQDRDFVYSRIPELGALVDRLI